jgi:formylglycine-generating enzyme required for sulfatase activity
MSSSTRNPLAIALIYVLAHCTPVTRADEPALRIGDDCVIPLVRVVPGNFAMGRSSRGARAAAALSFGEQGDWATEGPVRNVTISKPFSIGKYKITAEQFCRFLNSIAVPERFVGINQFSYEGRRAPWGNKDVSAWATNEGAAVDAFPENQTPEGVVGMVDLVVGEWCADFYGVRYIPEDTIDPKGPSREQLPVQSDFLGLATVKGEYHVLRGRVKRSNWSTTARNMGDRATESGIYGFRIVVETDPNENKP